MLTATRTKIKSSLMTVMSSAALKAAKGLIHDFNEVEHLQVSKKGPGNFISTADHRAEKTIRFELQKARPDFGFLLEESGEIPGPDSQHRWIVDPLDGTTNFLHGIPHFAISIGLQFEDEIIAGVIYDPIKDELFYAEKGKGAYLNDRRLRVSGRKELSDALILTEKPYKRSDEKENFSLVCENIRPHVAALRQYGASVLDLAYVAAGRSEGFISPQLAPWDLAAGLILVREAGGYTSDLKGGKDPLKNGSILAANAYLYEPLLKILQK